MGRKRRNGEIEQRRQRNRTEAKVLIRGIADPRQAGDTVKAAIARAAIRLGWKPRRTENIWRGRARIIEVWEMDELRNYKPE